MATIKLGGNLALGGVFMEQPAFPDPALATGVVETSTTFKLTYGGGYSDQFTGTGFHYDSAGVPDGGLIKTWAGVAAGVTRLQATGLSVAVSDFMHYYNIGDWTGLLSTALAGNDVITGSTLADHIYGFGGNDTLDGGKGNDTLAGGNGDDTYVLDNKDDKVEEDPSSGTDTVKAAFAIDKAIDEVENYIFTGKGNWTFTGNDLDNAITGGTGIDTLTGGKGDDTLDGGKGNDILTGGLGNDTYIVDSLNDQVKEDPGAGTADTVKASISFVLSGNIENLILTGKAAINGTGDGGANTITGNDGNNLLDGNGGADTLIGGKGNDTYVLAGGDDTVIEDAKGGTDTVKSDTDLDLTATGWKDQEIENITLLDGASKAVGNALNNVILGNAAGNRLDGGAGNDTLTGGDGNDTYVIDSAGDKVVESGKLDTDDTVETSIAIKAAIANVENYTYTGKDNWVFTGSTADNAITGAGGNDTLDGGKGNDTLTGGAGDDTYVLDSADDEVVEQANEGTDTVKVGFAIDKAFDDVDNYIFTGKGNWTFTGNELDNVITGGAGTDTLNGGGGNDTLDGGKGIDSLSGGGGDDTYIVDNTGDTVTEAFGEGTDTVKASISFALSGNTENLILTGKAAINGTGDGGDNTITGNDGNNVLDGGGGADTLIGGKGNDTYILAGGDDTVIEGAKGGTDTVKSDTDLDLTATGWKDQEIENVTLLDGASNAVGNALNNVILGNAADNRLDGGAGNDTLTGGDGNDTYVIDSIGDKVVEAGKLDTKDAVETSIAIKAAIANVENYTYTGIADWTFTGSTVDNEITGGTGNDTLDGGKGNDILAGGAGNDTYLLDSAGDTVTEQTADGTDTVKTSFAFTKAFDEVENYIFTGKGDWNFTGNTLDNVITAGAANDTLDGGAGTDTLVGGAGNDTYFIDSFAEALLVSDSAGSKDTVISSALVGATLSGIENYTYTGKSNWTFNADDQANTLIGGSGDDVLSGGKGDDTLDGGAGKDSLSGGAGNDTYFLDDVGDKVSEAAQSGIDTVETLVNVDLSAGSFLDQEIENVTVLGEGTAAGITGNSLNNIINASASTIAVSLSGGDGNDTLTGGSANDVLDGGAGKDSMTGGKGDDTYFVDALGEKAVEAKSEGTDTIVSSVLISTATANIENYTYTGNVNWKFTADAADNVLIGGSGNDVLDAGQGNDTLDGGIGADVLKGGSGNDTYFVDNVGDKIDEAANKDTGDLVRSTIDIDLQTLGAGSIENAVLLGSKNLNVIGNAASNTLLGNDGDNQLTGGAGNDVLTGGAGDDTAIFSGTLSQYQLVYSSHGVEVTDKTLDEGVDQVDGIEHLKFADITLDVPATTMVRGAAAGDALGHSVAGAGDVNNDGYADFIVSAPQSAGGGAAYVVFGGDGGLPSQFSIQDLNGTNGFRIDPEAKSTQFGISVASAGDFNKDGFDDLIVTTGYGDPRAYVVYGHGGSFGATVDVGALTGSTGFEITGESFFFPQVVGSVGDLNGDGYDDVALGVQDSNPNTEPGYVYIVFGHGGAATDLALADLDGSNGFKIAGTYKYDHTGSSVSSAGDINGDGIEDLLIGADRAGDVDKYGSNLEGAAYVVFGHKGGFTDIDLTKLDGTNGFEITRNYPGAMSGFSVASAGDLNGDGIDDIIVGGPNETGYGGNRHGGAFVLFGHTGTFDALITSTSLNGKDGFRIVDTTAYDRLGYSVSAAGDVNGDGFADIIVSTPGLPEEKYGGAYVLFGSEAGFSGTIDVAQLDIQHGIQIRGDSAGDKTGVSVATAGDINGDGFDDLMVGVPGSDIDGTDSGSVTIFYGGDFSGLGTIVGTNAGETLKGTAAADSIRGVAGDDTLEAAGGDDRLDGGAGDDVMKGGAGNDVYIVDSAGDSIDEQGNTDAADIVRSTVTVDLASLGGGAIENAILVGAKSISATGNGSDNVLTGNGVQNTLSGADGNDTLIGNGGKDTLNGGAGDDILVVKDLSFAAVDGGQDTDTLALSGDTVTLDLALYAGNKITNVERLDLTGPDTTTVELTENAVLALSSTSDALRIDGDLLDVVQLSNEFTKTGTTVIDGIAYREYQAGSATVLIGAATILTPGDTLPTNEIDLASLQASQGFTLKNSFYKMMGVGDINGDGLADLVGVRFKEDPFTPDYTVTFGARGDNLTDLPQSFKITNVSWNSSNGLTNPLMPSIGGAGDINGDGFNDIAIVGGTGAFILNGHADPFSATIDFSKLTGAAGMRIVGNVTGIQDAGDINGDGYSDLLVSTQIVLDKETEATEGGISIVFGGPNTTNSTVDLGKLDGKSGFAIDLPAELRQGDSVAAVGDLNGDGYDDIAVGAWPNKTLVYFGHGGTFSGSETVTADGHALTEFVGTGGPITAAGDVNGDGYGDIFIANWNYGLLQGGTQDGAGFLVFGTADGFGAQVDLDALDGVNGFRLDGPAESMTGVAISGAGDFNGDGYADLLITSGSTGPGNGTHSNSAFFVYGHGGGYAPDLDLSDLNGLDGFEVVGAAIDQPVSSASFAGDLNGDGYDDIVVLSTATYVLYGGDFRAEATELGDDQDNDLTGTAGADLLAAGDGNDTLHGAGGRDSLQGGGGNDQIHVADVKFFRIDGGSGTDTLHLDYSGTIDFANLDGNAATSDRGKIAGIEIIDVANGFANALTLHKADLLDFAVQNINVGGVASLDNVLKIEGDAGDTLALSKADGWGTTPDTATLAGYAIYTVNLVRVAVDTDIQVTLS